MAEDAPRSRRTNPRRRARRIGPRAGHRHPRRAARKRSLRSLGFHASKDGAGSGAASSVTTTSRARDGALRRDCEARRDPPPRPNERHVSWLDYQKRVRDVLLRPSRSGRRRRARSRKDRWHAYRRMVRSRFYQVVDHAFERTIAVAGADRFHSLIDLWPTTRRAPLTSATYRRSSPFRGAPPGVSRGADATPALRARFSCASNGPSSTRRTITTRFDRTTWCRSTWKKSRSCALLTGCSTSNTPCRSSEPREPAHPRNRAPSNACLYRDRTAHEVETLELTPIAATHFSGHRPPNDAPRSKLCETRPTSTAYPSMSLSSKL